MPALQIKFYLTQLRFGHKPTDKASIQPCVSLLLLLCSDGYFYLYFGTLLCEYVHAGQPYRSLWRRWISYAFKSI
jgi:hypothetical protein